MEPRAGAGIGLVLPDQNGMRDGQEAHQGAMLKEIQDFRLICETPEDEQSVRKTVTAKVLFLTTRNKRGGFF